MPSQLGLRIRKLRINQKLLIRQLASQLEVDTSVISKIERGTRQLKKEQIPTIALILKADKDELLTLWLADQVYELMHDENLALKAMQVAKKQIKYNIRNK